MNAAEFGCSGCLCVWLFGMYEGFYAIIHKVGLYALSLWYENFVSIVLGIHEISYAISHEIRL